MDASVSNTSIFEKFTRGIDSPKAQPEGSGLGLYIVKKIIENSGGTIWFESNAENGTTFYLTIGKGSKKINK